MNQLFYNISTRKAASVIKFVIIIMGNRSKKTFYWVIENKQVHWNWCEKMPITFDLLSKELTIDKNKAGKICLQSIEEVTSFVKNIYSF